MMKNVNRALIRKDALGEIRTKCRSSEPPPGVLRGIFASNGTGPPMVSRTGNVGALSTAADAFQAQPLITDGGSALAKWVGQAILRGSGLASVP